MRKIDFIFGFFCLLIMNTAAVSAQSDAMEAADKAYQEYRFVDVQSIYERLYQKGIKSEKSLLQLANTYFLNGHYDKAQLYYKEWFHWPNRTENKSAILRYYSCLNHPTSLNQAEFDAVQAAYKLLYPNKKNGEPLPYFTVDLSVQSATALNSASSDYAPAYWDDQLVFTSTRDTGLFQSNRHAWNGQGFSNLYQSKQLIANTFEKPKRYNAFKTRFHESSAIITKNGQTTFFTRNSYDQKGKHRNGDGSLFLSIYQSDKLPNGKWGPEKRLPFCSDQFQTANPAISADGCDLYFASDRPGGYGSSDLYRVRIPTDGKWGTPENLGPSINTPSRETFPFITEQSDLIFASDRPGGMGGLDIYIAQPIGRFWQLFKNKEPLNSASDDFGFILHSSKKEGFFCSNRLGGKGDDDIYYFNLQTDWPKPCVFKPQWQIIDEYTKLPITDQVVNYQLLTLAAKGKTRADAKGHMEVESLPCGQKLELTVNRKGYFPYRETIEYDDNDKTYIIALKPEKIPLKLGDNLAQLFDIHDIYFDLDQWDIRPEAATELAQIAEVMRTYPSLTICIESHTDSRQTALYNQTLSEKRAYSTRQWIIDQGIAPARLAAVGMGESQLVNPCADGVPCTEAEHQQNRRSVFVITHL
ncbi:MAG: hypothetical protein CFE24_02580 [Flavobacterium sp. BFFFF2]|nr:MAG: hypothetical protein CFE24_02580 [Flavobacterium sp. BFFFF2]